MTQGTKQRPGLWLHGSSGRMGKEIQKALVEGTAPGLRLVGGSDRTFEGEHFHQGRPVTAELLAHALEKDGVDVVIDFSTEDGNGLLLQAVQKSGVRDLAVLIGTTGLPKSRLDAWKETAKEHGLKLMIAPNTSVGVLMTLMAALRVAAPLVKIGYDVEITETHHRMKKDAPSGTAMFLANGVADSAELKVKTDRSGAREKGELGVHAVRGGGVFGEHEIRFLGDNDEVRISHRAFSRALFATGALVLAQWVLKRPAGVYGLLDVSADELAP